MGGQKGEKLKVPQAGREGRLGKAAGGAGLPLLLVGEREVTVKVQPRLPG